MRMAGTPPQGYAQLFLRAYRLPLRSKGQSSFREVHSDGLGALTHCRHGHIDHVSLCYFLMLGPKHAVTAGAVGLHAPVPSA
jgi:hypothetical protein